MGFDFVECERFGVDANGYQENPAWVPSAVTLGVWMARRTRMWNDTHRQMTPYMMVDMVMDCRRGQDAGVIKILNRLPA